MTAFVLQVWLLVLAGGQLTATEYDVDEASQSECLSDQSEAEFKAKHKSDVMVYSIKCHPAEQQ